MSKSLMAASPAYRAYILRVWPRAKEPAMRFVLVDIDEQGCSHSFPSAASFLHFLEQKHSLPADERLGGIPGEQAIHPGADDDPAHPLSAQK